MQRGHGRSSNLLKNHHLDKNFNDSCRFFIFLTKNGGNNKKKKNWRKKERELLEGTANPCKIYHSLIAAGFRPEIARAVSACRPQGPETRLDLTLHRVRKDIHVHQTYTHSRECICINVLFMFSFFFFDFLQS